MDKEKGTILGIGGTVIIDSVLDKAAKEATEKAEREAAEKAAKEAAEKATRETTEKIVTESAEKAIKDNTDKAAKAAKEAFDKNIAGSSDTLATEATRKILKEGIDKAIDESTEKLIKEATEKAVREGTSTATLDLTIKLIKETALKTKNESISILLKNSTTDISKKSIKKAALEKLLKTDIFSLSKKTLVPKLSFKLQSKSLLSISKTLGKDSASIVKLTSKLTKLAKSSGKISAKLGIKASTKVLSLAKALKPGPFAMFDIVNFALDVADVGGYGNMTTKSELYKTKSQSEKERKIRMYEAIQKALGVFGISFELADFVWPVVVDPLEDTLDDELDDKIMEYFDNIMLTADTTTPDPIIVPYLKAINDDITNGKISTSGVTTEQKDRYVSLIDMDSVIKLINIEACEKVGGLIYDGDKCTLTQEKCESNYSWPITDDDIYTEFKDGKCVQADPQMREICDKMELKYNTETGICDIDAAYCKGKGAAWKNDDCHISLEQKVLEAIFGTTFTRSLLLGADAVFTELSKPADEVFNRAMLGWGDLMGGDGDDYKEIYVPSEIKIKEKCLDVKHGKYPKLQIWDCNRPDNQKFLYDDNNGKIMFTGTIENNPRNYTYCLEAPYNSNGTQLYLNKCSDNIKQKFEYHNSQLRHSETLSQYGDVLAPPYTCIDLMWDDNTNGNNFQLLGCSENDAQKFDITKRKVKKEANPPRSKNNYKGFE